MTRAVPQAPVRRREREAHRMFFPGDAFALPAGLLLLCMPAFALSAAGWALQMTIVLPMIVASLAVGFLIARSRFSELYALLLSLVYGFCILLLVGALAQPGGFGAGLISVFSRAVQWFIDAFTGGINQDDLVFTLLISSLFWFLGFNLSWHLFRVNHVWRAVLPPGLILIVNGVYYVGGASLQPYLIGYVVLVLLLIVRANIESHAADWAVRRLGMPPRLRRQLFFSGALLTVLLLGAWLIPTRDVQERLNRFQEFLSSEPLQQISEFWLRLFSAAETQGPATSDYYGGDSLQLGGAIRLGDEVALYVSAPPQYRYYWRSRVFDIYDMGRWTSAADTRLTDQNPPLSVVYSPNDTLARTQVRQQFTLGLSASRIVYTAPQPLMVDLPTRTDLRYTPDNAMLVSVIRPAQVIDRGESYSAASLISTASAAELRAAGTNYPQYIRDLYPPQIASASARTLELARQIVAQAGAATPYDQAKAIETWLRANIFYDERIPQPPAGQDPVDWVLFDERRGYCNYYASAMVVMARSLGIPARMAAGFAQGTFDPAQNAFIVRERDAHTWVEVYFPGYGWVEFEPTAAQAPLDRGDTPPVPLPAGGDERPSETPSPTLSPTPMLTPTPPPTQMPTATATAQGEQAQSQSSPPTATPSPTPSPTATPLPAFVPTPPPPERPQRSDPFDFILPALGTGLLALLALALLGLALLFAYWWWEWRGMRGLSPIARAYARLERYLGLIGIRPRPQQTPEERRRMVAGALPVVEPPVTAITALYSSERYGPPRPDDEAALVESVAGEAWADAREGIIRRWLRRRLMPWKKR